MLTRVAKGSEVIQQSDAGRGLLRRFYRYESGIPTLDPELFKACFQAWVSGLRDSDADIIAIDGKTSRRSHDRRKGRNPLHLVSAWARSPAAPVTVSTPMPAGQCVFMRIPPGWVGDQHPSPQKQLVVCVSGVARFRGSDEATHVLRAGESLIDANTEGPGHVSEIISDVPFEAFLIALT